MLEFTDSIAFNQIMHDLHVEDTSHYYDQFPYDSFEDEPVLRIFEDTLNFLSLRKSLHERKVQLMRNGDFDINSDPDTLVVNAPIIMSILNPDMEVKIGGSIFKYLNNNNDVMVKVTSNTENQWTTIDDIENAEGYPDELVQHLGKKGVKLVRIDAKETCMADFAIQINPDGSISFINTSSYINPNISFHWNFENGGSYNGQTPPDKNFSQETEVCLTISADGCTDKICKIIDPNGCNAEFTFNKQSTYGINFTDYSVSESGNINSWEWDFGDGGTSGSENPFHSFSSPGTYTVCLEITDNSGCTDKICKEIYIKGECCELNDHTPNQDKWHHVGGNKWMKTKFYVTNLVGFRFVGAKTKYAEKGLFGIKFKKKADIIEVNADGHLYTLDNDDNKCGRRLNLNYPPQRKTNEKKAKYGEELESKHQIRMRKHSIVSYHYVEDGGVSRSVSDQLASDHDCEN